MTCHRIYNYVFSPREWVCVFWGFLLFWKISCSYCKCMVWFPIENYHTLCNNTKINSLWAAMLNQNLALLRGMNIIQTPPVSCTGVPGVVPVESGEGSSRDSTREWRVEKAPVKSRATLVKPRAAPVDGTWNRCIGACRSFSGPWGKLRLNGPFWPPKFMSKRYKMGKTTPPPRFLSDCFPIKVI